MRSSSASATTKTRTSRKTIEARREHFYEVRKNDKLEGDVERGARLVFLNKTCFNGLWRVNAAGRFNVPFGKYASPKILDEGTLKAASRALACAEIRCADYSEIAGRATPRRLRVLRTLRMRRCRRRRTSPPTRAIASGGKSRLSSPTRSRSSGRRACMPCSRMRATAELHKLYRQHHFHVTTIRAARAINSDPTKRGEVEEIVATTYDPPSGTQGRVSPPRTRRTGASA